MSVHQTFQHWTQTFKAEGGEEEGRQIKETQGVIVFQK